MSVASRRALPCVLLLAIACAPACGGGGGPPPSQAAGVALTEVRPPAGDLAGGATLEVLGQGFDAAEPPLLVHVGGRVVAPAVRGDTLLALTLPPGDAPGPVDVVLVTGAGLASLPAGFTYLPAAPLPPTLAYAPPVGAHVAGLGGTRVDLTLTHFDPLVVPTVTFEGLPAANPVLLDERRLRVEVPEGLPTGQSVEIVLTQGSQRVSASGFRSQGPLIAGTLTINEFLPHPGTLDANRDGTLSSSGDEFVEIVNRGILPVDLSGWTLHDASALRHTFPNPTTVPAGGSIVVFGSGNPTYFPPRHASGHALLASTGDLGLNNTADAITLRDPAAAVLAQATYLAADVVAGKSRNASTDGGALPVPAASVDYSPHDALPGAVGPVSPGTRANGAAFP